MEIPTKNANYQYRSYQQRIEDITTIFKDLLTIIALETVSTNLFTHVMAVFYDLIIAAGMPAEASKAKIEQARLEINRIRGHIDRKYMLDELIRYMEWGKKKNSKPCP